MPDDLQNMLEPWMREHFDAQRNAILDVCERWGFGATIVIAARRWAEIPPNDRKGMAQWLRYAADEIAGLKIGHLERVRDNLKLQAKVWAQEARTQQGIVLGILREFGLPLRDWQAETNVREHVAKLRTDLADTLKLLRDSTPALFSWNDGNLYMRVHAHLERLDPQPDVDDGPWF